MQQSSKCGQSYFYWLKKDDTDGDVFYENIYFGLLEFEIEGCGQYTCCAIAKIKERFQIMQASNSLKKCFFEENNIICLYFEKEMLHFFKCFFKQNIIFLF